MRAEAPPLMFAPAVERQEARGFFVALALHLVVLLAIVWVWDGQKDQPPPTFAAELWADIPTESAPAPPPAPPPEAQTAPHIKPLPTPPQPAPAPAPPPTPAIVEHSDKTEKKPKNEKSATPDKAKNKTQEDAKAEREREKQRRENIARMMGFAGASNDKGADKTSAAPSASYLNLIKARIRPNVVFTDPISDNPTAEVEVRCAPEGSIISRKIVKSSHNKAWDEAVLRAIDRTEVLPRDTDGRVPSHLIIVFRPKDL